MNTIRKYFAMIALALCCQALFGQTPSGPIYTFTQQNQPYSCTIPNGTSYTWIVTATPNGTVATTGWTLISGNSSNAVIKFTDERTNETFEPDKFYVRASALVNGSTVWSTSLQVFTWDDSPVDMQSIPAPACGGFIPTSANFKILPSANMKQVSQFQLTLPEGVSIYLINVPTPGMLTPHEWGLKYECYASSGVVEITPIYPCGEGSTYVVPLTITAQLSPPSPIEGPTYVCQTDPVVYFSIDPVPGATSYQWKINGNIAANTTNVQGIVPMFYTGVHQIEVTPMNTSCSDCNACPNAGCNYCNCPDRTSSLTFTVSQAISQPEHLDYTYSWNDIATNHTEYLYSSHCEYATGCAIRSLNSAMFNAKLDLGEVFNFASASAFSADVDFNVNFYSATTPIPMYLLQSNSGTLHIDNNQPEHLFQIDISSIYNGVVMAEIVISNQSGSGFTYAINQEIGMRTWIDEEYLVDVNPDDINNTTPLVQLLSVTQEAGVGQYKFDWQSNCENSPTNYELQLLRLYNTSSANQNTPGTILPQDIDWSEALSIETQSAETKIVLTVAEGTGYYIWRVRPIGNFYPGGMANDKNWGVWSLHSGFLQGSSPAQISAPGAPLVLWLVVPDENVNWIFSRTFAEGSVRTNEGIRIAESMTFANGLQQVLQTQRHLAEGDYTIAMQTVMDYSGRPALQSLPVPILDQDFLGYETMLLRNSGGSLYTAADFDADVNYLDPAMVEDVASHFAYYSNNNLVDDFVANADGFPYNRTLFYADGTGKVKEQGAAGKTHSIINPSDPEESRTTKTYYSVATDQELIYAFGDEAPAGESVGKVINIDPNGTASVTYVGKDGKTIATCLAITNGYQSDDDLLEDLPSQLGAGLTIHQDLVNDTPLGEYGSESSTTVTVVQQTDLTVHFDITPNSIQSSCANYCATCDYVIELSVQDVENPDPALWFHDEIIPPAIGCPANGVLLAVDQIVTLPPGTYKITRRIYSYTENGSSYLSQQIADLETILESQVSAAIQSAIDTYLQWDNVQLDEFYTAISNGSYDPENPPVDGFIHIPLDCGTLDIPVLDCVPLCEQYEGTTPSQFWFDFWHDPEQGNNPAYENLDALLPAQYNSAVFDQLFANMKGELMSDGLTTLYDCNKLWECWISMATGYESLLELENQDMSPYPDYEVNLVREFLSCAGYHLQGSTLNATLEVGCIENSNGSDIIGQASQESYLTHAYAYFDESLVIFPESDYCRDAIVGAEVDPEDVNSPTYPAMALWSDPSEAYGEQAYLLYYMCLVNVDLNAVVAPSNPQEACEQACIDRLPSFETALWNEHHQNNTYVQVMDVNAVYENPFLLGTFMTSNDPLPTNISWVSEDHFACQVALLLDHCLSYCEVPVELTDSDPSNDPAGIAALTPEMIDNIEHVMTSNFDVEFSTGGSCPPGYTNTGTLSLGGDPFAAGFPTYQEIVDEFNSAMDDCMEKIVTGYNFPISTPGNQMQSGWFIWPNAGGYDLVYNFDPHFPGLAASPDCRMSINLYLTDQLWSNPGAPCNGQHAPPSCVPANPSWYGIYQMSLNFLHNGQNTRLLRYVMGEPSYYGSPNFADVLAAVNAGNGGFTDVMSELIMTGNGPSINIVDMGGWNGDGMGVGGLGATCYLLEGHPFWSTNWGYVQANMYSEILKIDRCVFDCGPLCFQWTSNIIEVPADNEVANFTPYSCEQVAQETIMNAIAGATFNYVNTQVQEYQALYESTCANPALFNDNCWIEYSLGYHHYTLYYNDRAGRLIKTVPPAGVQLGASNRTQHPNHTMVTEYYYNSLGQLERQKTPDAGESYFWYNKIGQLRFSQNAQQLMDGKFSYSMYDELGRVYQVGQGTLGTYNLDNQVELMNWPDNTVYPEQVVNTVYTLPTTDPLPNGEQQTYLTNRVSYTYTDEGMYTYYSYDPHGNVTWLVQSIPNLGQKIMYYTYDLISGNVLEFAYQPGEVDQYWHRYSYDSDNKLVLAEMSNDHKLWQKNAKYDYYLHGPLKRSEIGHDQIQGLDFVYTIQGWIKALNYPDVNSVLDPGMDGGFSSSFAQDAFGSMLSYYTGDYTRNNAYESTLPTHLHDQKELFNVNISAWSTHTGVAGSAYTSEPAPTGWDFRYDELNRLLGSNFQENNGGWSGALSRYYTRMDYDANGNIGNLHRNESAGNSMDKFGYVYWSGTNKLHYVDDAQLDPNISANDIDGVHVYSYDEIGNLIKDSGEQISNIEWTVYGKVKHIHREYGSPNNALRFYYNASGNRNVKEVMDTYDEAMQHVEYYIHDGSGNVVATYKRKIDNSDPMNPLDIYTLKDHDLYGSGRIGQHRPESLVVKTVQGGTETISVLQHTDYAVRLLHQNVFEISDHLGNVRAVVTDTKMANFDAMGYAEFMDPELLSVANYYPFGMEMDGMTFSSPEYRYGFNGKEKDDEVKGSGNSLDYGFRIYDNRIGRFLSVDPLTSTYPWFTPYQFSSNDPIRNIDLDGLEGGSAIEYVFTSIGRDLEASWNQTKYEFENWWNSWSILPNESPNKPAPPINVNTDSAAIQQVDANQTAASANSATPSDMKKSIDLSGSVPWVSQFTLSNPNVACCRASQKILKDFGIKAGGSKANRFIVGRDNADHTAIKPTDDAKAGVDYITQQLEAGSPVMIGVNHTLNKGQADGEAADHYVVITGRGYDEEKKQTYFTFYEVGTKHKDKGTSKENRLYVNADNLITGTNSSKKRKFTVTDIRKN